MNRPTAIIISFLLMALPSQAATVRIGLVVGNNLGLSKEVPLKYAEADARRMRGLLTELGGFDSDRIVLLLGKDGQTLENTLLQIHGRIAEITARGDEALLLFYYSGHGSSSGLHLGNTQLDAASLREKLEATGAAVVIGIIDACHSGRIGRAKGGVPDETFDVTLHDEPSPRGTVLIASSQADELSQESLELQGSLFTHYLISALRGEADYDQNGRVTVIEAYRSTYNRTLAKSVITSSKRQHPMADIDISGKGEIVLTYLRKSSASIQFTSRSTGRYMIVESLNGRVTAELHKEAGREVSIALPQGNYQIYKQHEDEYLVQEVNLVWGGGHHLDEKSMKRFPYQVVASKGMSRRMHHNRISVQGEVVDAMLPGMSVWVTGGVGYERFFTTNLSLGLALAYTRQDFTFEPGGDFLPLWIDHHELRTRLTAAYRFEGPRVLPSLAPTLGFLVEYLHAWQEQVVLNEPEYRYAESFHMLGLGLQLGFEIKLPGCWTLLFWGRTMIAWTFLPYTEAKRERYLELVTTPSKSRQNILFFSGGLGLAWDF
ncbi:MAG: caspase family protein [Deltaproteobacteria bacterium]|nr:caspase family protein [Deltaproteobacteria bacterium]